MKCENRLRIMIPALAVCLFLFACAAPALAENYGFRLITGKQGTGTVMYIEVKLFGSNGKTSQSFRIGPKSAFARDGLSPVNDAPAYFKKDKWYEYEFSNCEDLGDVVKIQLRAYQNSWAKLDESVFVSMAEVWKGGDKKSENHMRWRFMNGPCLKVVKDSKHKENDRYVSDWIDLQVEGWKEDVSTTVVTPKITAVRWSTKNNLGQKEPAKPIEFKFEQTTSEKVATQDSIERETSITFKLAGEYGSESKMKRLTSNFKISSELETEFKQTVKSEVNHEFVKTDSLTKVCYVEANANSFGVAAELTYSNKATGTAKVSFTRYLKNDTPDPVEVPVEYTVDYGIGREFVDLGQFDHNPNQKDIRENLSCLQGADLDYVVNQWGRK